MSYRIKKIFENKTKKLLTFTTAGDPNINTSIEILNTIINKDYSFIDLIHSFLQYIKLFCENFD